MTVEENMKTFTRYASGYTYHVNVLRWRLDNYEYSIDKIELISNQIEIYNMWRKHYIKMVSNFNGYEIIQDINKDGYCRETALYKSGKLIYRIYIDDDMLDGADLDCDDYLREGEVTYR